MVAELLVVCSFGCFEFVITSAIDCLERNISDMICLWSDNALVVSGMEGTTTHRRSSGLMSDNALVVTNDLYTFGCWCRNQDTLSYRPVGHYGLRPFPGRRS